jgi:phosphoglycolate phosphatase
LIRDQGLIRVDAAIFDLDGTLWNASKTAAKAWNRALRDIGLAEVQVTDKDIQDYSGIPLGTLLEREFTCIPSERREDFTRVYAAYEKSIMKEGGELYPGVREALSSLSRTRKLFIVSNCLEGYIENFLEFCELGWVITGFECSGRTGKPKCENIRKLIEEYHLERAVYIGDTKLDQDASAEAGIPFIHAAYGFGNADSATYAIEKIEDLLTLLG